MLDDLKQIKIYDIFWKECQRYFDASALGLFNLSDRSVQADTQSSLVAFYI